MTEARIDKVSATQFDRPGDWIIHLANGETMTLAAVMHDAIAWQERPSAGAVERAVNRSNHAAERAASAERLHAGAERTLSRALNTLATANRKNEHIIKQAREWKHRALAAEAATDRIEHAAMLHERDLRAEHRERLHEAQANALNTINRLAEQLPAVQNARARDVTAHYSITVDGQLHANTITPKSLDATISRQLDTIRDQDERIDMLKDREQALLKENSSLRSILADRSAEVNTLTQALDVCRSKLADAIGENTQLDESLADMRKLAEANGMNVNALRERLAEAESESTEVIRKCNEQLAALAAAAKLRDQQVESLARLWSAAFDHRGSPLGPVLTRQLYRVMADHGVDVSHMPESREQSAVSSHKSTSDDMHPHITQIIKEHTQLAQRARAVLASWRATDDGAVPDQLSVEIAKLAIIVEPPLSDVTDCA